MCSYDQQIYEIGLVLHMSLNKSKWVNESLDSVGVL